MIDSITDTQLTNYEVSIVRLNPDGTETVVQRVVVPANAQPNPLTGEIRWESTPNSLTTGIYRVDVTDPPPGYRVVPDQVLDPDNPNAPVMQFEIKPTAEDPLRLNDIEADPFPTLKGTIFKPLLTNPTTNDVSFVPLDDNSLAVTLACPAAPNVVPAVLSDENPAVRGLDTYFFDAITLESNALLGACVITVSATGFVSASVTMDPPLAASDGVTRTDQIVNVALVAPNDPIAGTVVWLDHGFVPPLERPIDGVTVATESSVIIGFDRAQGTDPNVLPTPRLAPTPLSSVTVAGTWRLDGQVFGQTTYSFTDTTRFDTGRMTVTIDETRNRQVAAVQSLVVSDLGVNGGIHVEMVPRPGAIVGRAAVASVQPVRFSDIQVQAVGPNQVTVAPVPNPADGTYTINPAAAGTWRLAFGSNGDTPASDPRDYSLAAGTPANVTTLVDPAATSDVGVTNFVEHPRVQFVVRDSAGNPINDNGVTPTLTVTRHGVPGTITQNADPATGSTFFRRLAFDPGNPTGVSVTYDWAVTMPGFDLPLGNADVTLNGATGFSTLRQFVPIQGSVTLRAGAKPVITITLPRFGALTGNVVGRLGANPGDPTEPLALSDPSLVVTARRVLALDTDPFLGRRFTQVSDAPITAVVDPNDPNGFLVSGPPGAYVIEATHPQYQVGFRGQPAGADDCPLNFFCPPNSAPRFLLPAGQVVYVIENDTNVDFVDPFVLEIRRMQLDFTVVTSRTTNAPVAGASVRITQGAVFAESVFTDGAGRASMFTVIPGSNTLEVRRLVLIALGAPPVDANFPVLATIDVPRFSTANNGIIAVTVVLPELGNRIGGAIGAVNSEGDAVPLPSDVVIDRVYHPAAVDFGGTPVNNDAREGQTPAGDVNYPGGAAPLTQLTVVAGSPPQTPVPFEFANIAAGVHDLTFSTEAGYAAPSPNPRTVTALNGVPNDQGQLNYVANNVRVVVNVTSLGAPLTTALVRLVGPDPNDTLVPVAAGGTYTFAAVPPEVLDYTLNITADLHTAVSQAVRVDPDADGVLTIDIALTASAGRIEGIARKDPGTGPVVLANEGSVQLQLANGTAVGSPVTPGPSGNYRFDVTVAGDYRVVASLTGFATRAVSVAGVALGRVTTAPTVTVLALATATVTVTGGAATESSLALTVTQPAASGLTPVKAGATFTVAGLDPDVDYRFQATANGFFAALVPPAAALNPNVGGTHAFSVALVERTVTVTVTTEDASGAENGATVRLRIPPGSATAISPTTTAGNVYTFGRLPSGAGQVSVAATGYRTQTAAVDASSAAQAVAITLPRLATISGTVFAANGTTAVAGATVTVTNGPSTRTATSQPDGSYSVPNLDVGTWSISATRLGAGTVAGAQVVVTATSPSIVTRNLTLLPRNVAVAFTVQAGSPAAPLSGATVSVDGVSQTTTATGTATVTVPENGALAWTVSAANRLTQRSTLTLTGLTASVSVTLVDRPTLAGTVVNNGGNPRNGASVFLCAQAAAVCDATTAVAQATTPAAGTFSFRPDVGTWQVRAVAGGNDTIITGIVVGADASVSQNNLVLTI